MNLFSTKLRRAATVAGGTFLGLGIVAAMAAPAMACDVKIKASSECGTDGGWVAKFEVANDWHPDARIVSVKVDGQDASVGDIKTDEIVGKDYSEWLTGTIDEPASKDSVELEVTMEWDFGDNRKDTDSSVETAYKPETKCETTPPTKPTDEPTKPTDEPTKPTDEPTKPTDEPTTPPGDTPEVPIPTPTDTPPSAEPAFPDEIFAVDCDSMTIGLDNTKGNLEFKMHFTPSKGAEKDLDIKPGEKKSVTFDAEKGFTVKVSIVAVFDGQTSPAETATIPYEAPEDCGNGSPSLPVTGAAAGGIAGGAAVLLVAGAGLFVMARRRKVRFTA